MYSSIMVPLDRTSCAEESLPLAISIAQRANARLDLVEVHALYCLEEHLPSRVRFEPKRDIERKEQEQQYLDAIAERVASTSKLSVTSAVLSGSAVLPETTAERILERVKAEKTSLIVMTTHGYGPLQRLGSGSVADELIRQTCVPVLLLRPSKSPVETFAEPKLSTFLIPLDGSTVAEQILEPVLELAKLMDAQCVLLRVIPTRTTESVKSLTEATQSEEYLDRIAGYFRERALTVETRVVSASNVVQAILDEAVALDAELIALATHGRGGLKRLFLGSVADKLIRTTPLPILIVRAANN